MLPGALAGGRRTASKIRSTRFSFICSRPSTWLIRTFAQTARQGKEFTESSSYYTPSRDTPRPETSSPPLSYHNPKSKRDLIRESYLDDLDSCLPSHLQRTYDQHGSATGGEGFTPNASKIARILLAHQSWSGGEGLLFYLAISQKRWRATVWIVKQLLEEFHAPDPQSNRLVQTIQQWNWAGSLDEHTGNPLYLKPAANQNDTPHIKLSSAPSLDFLTDAKPEDLSKNERFRHDIMGLIWQDLGQMIIACVERRDIASGEVKSEILEMIALLHHYELMPSSIYAYLPSGSDDAIQQPPTLHLLSSRILTALSDAAWRAHEMEVVEEAKRKGGQQYPMRPELPGSSYRVRVSAVKPEIWLELMLWSCLHGGWIRQGAALLSSLCSTQGDEQWRPISWRDSLRAIMPFGQRELLDWDAIKHMFDTQSAATMDGVDITGLRVDKTVSSEVVNAYVEALLSVVGVGVGNRGLSLNVVLRQLRRYRLFLQRSNLNLGGGTWDAVLVRIIESGGVDIDRGAGVITRLVELSPRLGEELQSQQSQSLPPYVLDGSAAVLGMLHRALRGQIRQGNLEGALRVFRLLQQRVDDDKHQSLIDFYQNERLASAIDAAPQDIFTSNFSGIDYPAFDIQIPLTTLAAFVELITTSKAYELGRWMLYSNDVDGPVIPESLYSEPIIASALVHFAIATDDMALLSKVVKLCAQKPEDESPRVPRNVLQAFLDAQFELRRWDAATRILDYMRDTYDFNWSTSNAAVLAKVMLLESKTHPHTADDPESDFARSQELFAAMMRGDYGGFSKNPTRDNIFRSRIDCLLIVLSVIDHHWADLCSSLRRPIKHFPFVLAPAVFNYILDGVTSAYGSKAGQRLIETFWRPAKEAPDLTQSAPPYEIEDVQRMPRFLQDAIEKQKLTRSVITLPGVLPERVAMYGSLEPDVSTARLLCAQALQEYREQRREDVVDVLAWVLASLARLRLGRRDVWVDIRRTLAVGDLERLKARAPRFQRLDGKVRADGNHDPASLDEMWNGSSQGSVEEQAQEQEQEQEQEQPVEAKV